MEDLKTEARWLREHATGCGTEWHRRTDALLDAIEREGERVVCPRCHGAGRYEWAGTTQDCGACGADGWFAPGDDGYDAALASDVAMRRRTEKIAALREWRAERLAQGAYTSRSERLDYWDQLWRLGVDYDQIERWDIEEQRQHWARKTEEMFAETGL